MRRDFSGRFVESLGGEGQQMDENLKSLSAGNFADLVAELIDDYGNSRISDDYCGIRGLVKRTDESPPNSVTVRMWNERFFLVTVEEVTPAAEPVRCTRKGPRSA